MNTANNRFTELVYDAAGNVTKDKVIGTGRMEYKYDAENHVVAAGNNFVTNNTAPTSQYFYDAAGKRTRKLVSGVETWFVYGIDGELVAEYNANTAVISPQKEYGYRSGQLLVVYDNTETVADKKLQWMVADHLGTPRMVIDKTGSLSGIKRHDYLPFGEEIGAGVGIRSAGNGYTADQIRKKFTGYERDVETGLDYAQARYFSSIQGRFTSPDEFNDGPIEVFAQAASANPTFYSDLTNPQSLNKYQYTFNNPLRYTDPDGHCPPCLQQLVNSPAGQQILAAAGVAATAAIVASTDAGTQIKNAVKEVARQAGRAADVVIEALGTPGMRPCDACFGNDPILIEGDRSGKDFTKKGKQEVIEANKAKNDGKTVCEGCKVETVPATQSKKGVTPDKRETRVDHRVPKSKGGAGSPGNGDLLCSDCNLKKSDKMPEPPPKPKEKKT